MKCCACNQPVNVKGDQTKFYEPLCEQMLEIAINALKYVVAGCTTGAPNCKCKESAAMIALEKIRMICK